MDNVNAKLQYLKGMANGITILDGDKFLLVDEIISTLEVMVKESAKITESMQREIEQLQSLGFDMKNSSGNRGAAHKRSFYDAYDDITAPFPYRSHSKAADVWHDESLNVKNFLNTQGLAAKDSQNIKVERICKHCGSYVSCDIAADEMDHARIQCPKCKRFLLPFDSNGIDALPTDIDEQIDNIDTSVMTDFTHRLNTQLKSFQWEVSEEVFKEEDKPGYDNQYDINSIIKDFDDHTQKADVEADSNGLGAVKPERAHVDLATKDYCKEEREAVSQPRPYVLPKGRFSQAWPSLDDRNSGINNSWEHYEVGHDQGGYEEKPMKSAWIQPREEAKPAYRERPAKPVWTEPQEETERPKYEGGNKNSLRQTEAGKALHQMRSERVDWEQHKPVLGNKHQDEHYDNNWELNSELPAKPDYEGDVSDHDWKLQSEPIPQERAEEEDDNNDWKLQREELFKSRTEERKPNEEWNLEPEEELTLKSQLEEIQEEPAVIIAEEAEADIQPQPIGAEEAPSPKSESFPFKEAESEHQWNEFSQPIEPVKQGQPKEISLTTEVEPELKTSEASKSTKEEEAGFDWNADFEFSIDKILSMEKKEKGDTASRAKVDTKEDRDDESKFEGDDFGKFKYTFDREDELERQRNKIAPNYNIDKKVLKKFSFLGYASELAKKNN